MYSERTLFDKATGDKVATMTQTTMLRGDGGFGGKSGPQPEPHVLPESAPDTHVDIKTASNAALIYRLCGDRNPLHADPEIAAKGGFKAPILHGLCTYAVAGRAILRACCANDPGAPQKPEGAVFLRPSIPARPFAPRSGAVRAKLRSAPAFSNATSSC